MFRSDLIGRGTGGTGLQVDKASGNRWRGLKRGRLGSVAGGSTLVQGVVNGGS